MIEWLSVMGFALIRAVSGYLQNALEDGVLEYVEWRKLAETVLVIVLPAVVANVGFGADSATVAAIITIILLGMDQLKRFASAVKSRKVDK